MYNAQGKESPKTMDDTVIYNRGILNPALHVEAIRNAIEAKGGRKPTGGDVKKGFAQINDFTLGGPVPPLKITPPITKAAAGSRSSRCMTADSSKRPTGAGVTRRWWPLQ